MYMYIPVYSCGVQFVFNCCKRSGSITDPSASSLRSARALEPSRITHSLASASSGRTSTTARLGSRTVPRGSTRIIRIRTASGRCSRRLRAASRLTLIFLYQKRRATSCWSTPRAATSWRSSAAARRRTARWSASPDAAATMTFMSELSPSRGPTRPSTWSGARTASS